MLAILAPGQGSQTPGMLAPWIDDAHAAALLASFSASADLDLVHLGTQADADQVTDTAHAQPLIVAASLLSAAALFGAAAPRGVAAGHSIGELAALAVAGVLSSAEAMGLAARRGAAMARAAAASPSGMSAVVNGERAEVLAAIEAAGATAANINSSNQIVAAGTAAQLATLAENPPARARVIPLKVAGAFHTEHMAPAVADFAAAANLLAPADPKLPLISNRDGALVTDGADAIQRLITQLTSPVRWDLCMARMLDLGVTAIIELAPGGVLSGLAKREIKLPAVAITGPDDLPAARELLEAHA